MRSNVLPIIVLCALALPRTALGLEWAGKTQRDINDLAHTDHMVRLAALKRLGQRPGHDALLIKALRDVAPNVRLTAAELCASRRLRRAVPVLQGWLSHWDESQRISAAEALGQIGDSRAVPSLVRALGDPEIKVRRKVVAALGALSTAKKVEVVPLLGRLRDTNSTIRKETVEVLAAKQDRRAVIPLMGLLDDPAREVRTAAVAALGVLGDTKAGPALVRLLRARHSGIRAAAIQALGKLRYSGATEALVDLLQRGAASHRTEAAAAIASIGNRQGISALIRALSQSSLRPAAAAALVSLEQGAGPHIARLIADDRTERQLALAAVGIARRARLRRAVAPLIEQLARRRLPRIELIRALGAIGDARAQRPLLELLADPNADVRQTALRALSPMLDARAAAPLLRLLDDSERQIKLRAMGYLGRLRSRQATAQLTRLALKNDRTLARAAVRALTSSRDPKSVPTLVRLISHRDRMLRRLASQALGRIASPAAVAPLLRLCTDSLGSVRVACLQALGGVLRGKSDRRAIDLAAKLLRGHDHSVILAATDALAAMRDPTIPRILKARFATLPPALQRSVAAVLGNAPEYAAASLPLLRRLVDDADDAWLRAAAAWAVGKLATPQAEGILSQAASDRHWAVRTNAAAGLSRLHAKGSRTLLRRLLQDRVPYVRANAALALGQLGDREMAGQLARVLERDRHPWSRLGALRALRTLAAARPLRISGRPELAQMERLTRRLAEDDIDPRVRQVAAAMLEGPTRPDSATWIGLFLLDPSKNPLRKTQLILVTPSGLIRAAMSDGRAELWEEDLLPGVCFVEIPSPGIALSKN